MKRTFRRHDGVEETIEGTPEELAEHERRLRDEADKANEGLRIRPTKPEILKGAEVDSVPLTEGEIAIVRAMREAARLASPPYTQPFGTYFCLTCNSSPCKCRVITFEPWITYGFGDSSIT